MCVYIECIYIYVFLYVYFWGRGCWGKKTDTHIIHTKCLSNSQLPTHITIIRIYRIRMMTVYSKCHGNLANSWTEQMTDKQQQQDHPLAQNSKKRGSGRIIHCEKVKADKECTELFVVSATVMWKTTNSTSAITLYSMYPYLHPLVGLIFICIRKSFDFMTFYVCLCGLLSSCRRWRPGVKFAVREGYRLRCRSWKSPSTATRACMSRSLRLIPR